ncbi:MAG: HNH endonuclease [Bacteroidota bacterium]
MSRKNWTKKETIVAFNVYCKVPFKASSKTNPIIIQFANIIGRTPSALNMKIGNFGRLDPELKKKGITGLKNGSQLEEEVWNEFHGNWDKLAFESEKIIAEFVGKPILGEFDGEFPVGKDTMRATKVRVNQAFFRSAVLSAYNSSCCITGINIPQLLVASHIIPWNQNKERTNPRNGLCLNCLHDKAFDKGLITINEDYRIEVSSHVLDSVNSGVMEYLHRIAGNKIFLPDRFLPYKQFLAYHRRNIFIK